MAKYDFSGWATRNDLQCADGRIIRKNAFKQQDGETVSLVWNHSMIPRIMFWGTHCWKTGMMGFMPTVRLTIRNPDRRLKSWFSTGTLFLCPSRQIS